MTNRYSSSSSWKENCAGLRLVFPSRLISSLAYFCLSFFVRKRMHKDTHTRGGGMTKEMHQKQKRNAVSAAATLTCNLLVHYLCIVCHCGYEIANCRLQFLTVLYLLTECFSVLFRNDFTSYTCVRSYRNILWKCSVIVSSGQHSTRYTGMCRITYQWNDNSLSSGAT